MLSHLIMEMIAKLFGRLDESEHRDYPVTVFDHGRVTQSYILHS